MLEYVIKALRLYLIGFFLFSFSGCALKTRFLVDTSTPVVEAMNVAFNKNCDITLMKDSLPFALTSLSGLIDISPNNKVFLTNGAHAYFGYSFAFIEDSDNERAKKLYKTAMGYGFKVLFKDNYQNIINAPLSKFTEHAEKIDKNDITPLFWTTLSWLSYIRINLGDVKVLLDIPKAEILARRLLELDEAHYFGSPHAVMGAYYSAQPIVTGGNPEKAKQHFDTAISISEGNFLMHHLFYAKFYAVRIQDRDLYMKLLQHVLDAPEDLLPTHCAITNLCKMKAKFLLESVDDYF